MTTLHLVDPSFRALLAKIPMFDEGNETLANYRHRVVEAYSSAQPPEHTEHIIPGYAGDPDVRVLVYRPENGSAKLPGVLSIHGGGFISGTADMVGAGCRTLADDFQAVVVNVNYRLAPETPFPGPLEDCYAALSWMFDKVDMLGIDPTRILVMGGSAGGGLAAALTLLVRDRGEFSIRAQVLNYPMLDARTGTPEAPVDNPLTGEFVWTREVNQQGWRSMRGDVQIPPERAGHFSPSLAEDLTNLAAAFIAVGSLDLLLEENLAYALRLARAGVPVEAHVYPGAVAWVYSSDWIHLKTSQRRFRSRFEALFRMSEATRSATFTDLTSLLPQPAIYKRTAGSE